MQEPIPNNANTTDNTVDTAWWRRPRWIYAAGAFFLGVLETSLALFLGFEFLLGEHDVTWVVGGLLELSFAAFGFLIGLHVEARQRESQAALLIQQQLEELAAIQARLAQHEKLASLGQLAGAMAHEVRNPLAILRSIVQNLQESLSPTNVDAQENCNFMLEEIDRLDRVTSTLVDFSRPLRLRLSWISCRTICQRTEFLARQLLKSPPLEEKGLKLTLRQPGQKDQALEVDPDLLCQVLLGLIQNAAEASPTTGEIILCWRPGDDHCVEFLVQDHGSGISPEEQGSIFEPFFTTREAGTGLGLAVARQIIEAQGGRVLVESTGPAGTTMLVQLAAGAVL